ncbi:MAG: glycoside hydrolase family 2 protein [Syntrophobacteraceae bacterium]
MRNGIIRKPFCLPLPALICVIENENGLEVRLHVHTDFFAKDILLKIKGSDAQCSDNYFDPVAGASKNNSGQKS